MTGLALAIEKAGSKASLARALGVQRQLVNSWRHRGVPIIRAVEIERKLGIPKELIRPDVFGMPQ
jgi:DNA-binding transcriptional regulator YdaS (Cro superfamily)